MNVCNFCRKSQKEVKALVATTDGQSHICNECVYLCIELMAPQMGCSPSNLYEEMKSQQERAMDRAQNPSTPQYMNAPDPKCKRCAGSGHVRDPFLETHDPCGCTKKAE